MMKKVLILAVVLSMASTASATLSLDGVINGEIDVGTTGIVTVISDDTSSWMGYICFDPPVGVAILPPRICAGEDAYVVPWNGCYLLEAVDMTEPFDSVQPGVQFEFSVYGNTVADVYTIDLYASDWTTILDSGTVTVVPEPMTIALLGLGGLFLLRRRR